MHKKLYESSKRVIFADSSLIESYAQGASFILFFHNKLLFYNNIE